MRRLALCNRKGGCGKTTTAINLSAALAARGQRVILIDTDAQGHVAISLGVRGFDLTLAELLDGKATLAECVIEGRPGLDIIPSDDRLASTKRGLARDDLGAHRLSKALEGLDGYDFAIVDTSPGWDTLSVGVLLFVHEVILPADLEFLSLVGVRSQIESVETIQEYNPDLEIACILPTKLDGRTRQSAEALGMLREHFGDLVAEPIRINVTLSEAVSFGQTIFEYDPRSRGAMDYARLAEEVLTWRKSG